MALSICFRVKVFRFNTAGTLSVPTSGNAECITETNLQNNTDKIREKRREYSCEA